jgi:peptidoglycan/xylan/chitin deacetylase (PgdA/CDA1 family)
MVLMRSARDATGTAAALEQEFDRRLPTLFYHRVGHGLAGLHPALSVSPDAFERQIAWLAHRGYTGIRPSDWVAWREGRGSLPRKSLLITFDDAYAEIGRHALPTLKRHGFGALVFVVTGVIGSFNTWDGYPASPDGSRPGLMTAEDLEHWTDQGIDFGAHSRTHADLAVATGLELEHEIRGSRDDLEAVIGRPVEYFAYPYGRHNQRARELVSATYQLAFTIEEGANGLRTPAHLLRRTAVSQNDRMFDIEWRARFGRAPFPRVRNEVRIRTRARALRAALRRA